MFLMSAMGFKVDVQHRREVEKGAMSVPMPGFGLGAQQRPQFPREQTKAVSRDGPNPDHPFGMCLSN